MFRLCVLGSGSSGNCIYFGADGHHWLVDAGLSGREISSRLQSIDVPLEKIDGVFVTHEHDDHIRTVTYLNRKYGIQLYANSVTAEAVDNLLKRKVIWNIFLNGNRFRSDCIEIEPFSVPHDAMDPVGFIIYKGSLKIGIVTDIGVVTTLVRQRLKGCDLIVLESNHDHDLLNDSKRPWSLKQRISGRHGHFSNEQAAELVSDVADSRLKAIFLAHLSHECNKPDRAFKVMSDMLRKTTLQNVSVELTYPDKISRMWVIDG